MHNSFSMKKRSSPSSKLIAFEKKKKIRISLH